MVRKIINPKEVYEREGLVKAVKALWLDGYAHEEMCGLTDEHLENIGLTESIVICVANPKGGTGKSTVAQNFAYASAQLGMKTAFIETDVNDANDALMLRGDTDEITSRDMIHAEFGDHPSALDSLIGRKPKGKKRVKKVPFEEIAIRSRTLPNLVYFLSEQLGERLGERGSQSQRDRVIRVAQRTLLEEARKLKGYHAIVIDLPAGTPAHLDAYTGCDARVYVVNFKNFSSFTGIENIARLVYGSDIDGNNHLVVNRVSGVKTKEDLERRLSRIGIGKAIEKLKVGSMEEAKRLVANTNLRLKGLGLDKLAFVSDTYVPNNDDIEDYSNLHGEPYLMAIATRKSKKYQTRDSFRREMHHLAGNIVKTTLEGRK